MASIGKHDKIQTNQIESRQPNGNFVDPRVNFEFDAWQA